MEQDLEAINAKWDQYSRAIDRLAERVADPDDFPVLPGSSLAGDDREAHPFEVSQAIRHILNVTIDQLHGVKVAVCDSQVQHLGVSTTLARAALENGATGLWILGPSNRNERIERVLRWHSRNYQDLAKFLETIQGGNPALGSSAIDGLAQIRDVAERRGIDPKVAANGYPVTRPISGGGQYTDLPVFSDWQIASGFAHGRPWAHQGFLNRERIDSGATDHRVFRTSPRDDMTIYFPLQALHLLGELLRLRDRRAGLPMLPRPDGMPDSEPRQPQSSQ